ncbi:hypothetical protein Tco_0763418 [Tanacetum coccineum]
MYLYYHQYKEKCFKVLGPKGLDILQRKIIITKPTSNIQPLKKRNLGGSSVPSKEKKSGKGDGSGPSKVKKGGKGGGSVPINTKKGVNGDGSGPSKTKKGGNGDGNGTLKAKKVKNGDGTGPPKKDVQLLGFSDVTITNIELAPTDVGLSAHAPSVVPSTQDQAPNEVQEPNEVQAPNEDQVPTQRFIVNSASSKVQVLRPRSQRIASQRKLNYVNDGTRNTQTS